MAENIHVICGGVVVVESQSRQLEIFGSYWDDQADPLHVGMFDVTALVFAFVAVAIAAAQAQLRACINAIAFCPLTHHALGVHEKKDT